ncbi:flavin monoamine oxidase family protein [Edwardsiella tarda]|uniref:flavin monoamine oxidase family protein n=1 Tax=Edwardsiella tarda TaxID=636 RepID=UPI00351C1A60
MNRREMLRMMSAALATLWLGALPTHAAERRPTRTTVLVIGAGLAGLACARTLQAQGFAVQVVEARQRIGGRIWTSHAWPEMPLDLGATWIHGTEKNPLTGIAEQIGARLLPTHYEEALVFAQDGRPLSAMEERVLERLKSVLFETLQEGQSAPQDKSILATVADIVQDASPSKRLNIWYLLNSNLEQELSGALGEMSTYYFDDDWAFGGEDALFPQGFSQITDHLAQGLTLALGQVVSQIAYSTTGVSVHTLQGEVFQADRVVITLPLGVLQRGHVTFAPALPADKLSAIQRLGMGTLNKCYLQFPHIFWPDDIDWLEYISPQPGVWSEWVSFARAAHWPVLLGFNAARQGVAMETLSDQQIVADAMGVLQRLFGPTIPQPLRYQITRWSHDPYSAGSYSYYRTGSTPRDRRALGKSVADRLYFAGEAVSRRYYGTAHGALLSGLQAAQEIANH